MIPKIVHYCWLSGDEFPESIKKSMRSWKEKLPDYEFVLWDKKRFDIESNSWVKQAYEKKKYAFAADYIRLYAVYTYGGIYLDTDVEVVKSFDELLYLPYFVGSEGEQIIEAGVFGAEKEMWWIKPCLDYYKDKSFIKDDGSLDTWTLPRIMMQQIGLQNKIVEKKSPEIFTVLQKKVQNEIYMFPFDFFCAKNHGTGIIEKTENTYCIHHFAMSWIPKSETRLSDIKKKLIKAFGVKLIYKLISILKLKELRTLFSSQKTSE